MFSANISCNTAKFWNINKTSVRSGQHRISINENGNLLENIPNGGRIKERKNKLGLSCAKLSTAEATGCPTKKFTFLKPVYLRPLILLKKSSVLEMNLWISIFKNTNWKLFRSFVFRYIKGLRYYSRFSGYSWPNFDPKLFWNGLYLAKSDYNSGLKAFTDR